MNVLILSGLVASAPQLEEAAVHFQEDSHLKLMYKNIFDLHIVGLPWMAEQCLNRMTIICLMASISLLGAHVVWLQDLLLFCTAFSSQLALKMPYHSLLVWRRVWSLLTLLLFSCVWTKSILLSYGNELRFG